MLKCAETKATEICKKSNWNETDCLCTGDFQQSVKVCLYRSEDDCNEQVPVWFEKVRGTCKEKGVEVKETTKDWSAKNNGGDGPYNESAKGQGGSDRETAPVPSPSANKESSAQRLAAGSVGALVIAAVAAIF